MSRDTITHSQGDSGTKPPSGLDFANGDFPNPQHFDWFWSTVIAAINGHASEFDALDTDGDGVVDKADKATELVGGTIDSNSDGVVDAADTAAQVKGNDIDSDADGVVDAADTASKFKGNDIDSDGDGVVDEADLANALVTAALSADLTGGGGSAIGVNTANLLHNNLGGISSDDHHAQVHNNTDHSVNFLPSSNYNPEADTHSKTDSASELTDVSADSVSNAHHGRYADSEARTAVEGTTSLTDLNGANEPLQLEVYSSESALPGSASEGTIAYVQSTGQVYVEDGN